jgi:hypothetical protein
MPRGLFGVWLLTLVWLSACSGPAPTVDQITVVNSTEYDLEIHVTGRERNGWLPMIIVEARSEGIARGVLDQGEVWIFQFRHLGDAVGEHSLSQEELERSGWRLEVPDEVDERLQQLGRSPSG